MDFTIPKFLEEKTQNTIQFLPKKNSINKYMIFSLFETFNSWNIFNTNTNISLICKLYKYNMFGLINYNLKKRLIVNLLFKDMIHIYKVWRHIKGYPVNGQRTWSNGKSVTKNNLFFKNFRVHQIIKTYGKKRKHKAQKLVLGEYVNKLWLITWPHEWKQARRFNLRSAKKRGKKRTIFIDLNSLASCITGGYKRIGKAIKFNKTKKRFKNVTIGLPMFFTRYIYTKVNDKMFKVDFSLMQIQRKFKAKKRIKKKINIKKKK